MDITPSIKEKRIGLVIIDMQAGSRYLADHFLRQAHFEDVLSRIQQLSQLFTSHNLPVYVVTNEIPLLPESINKRFSHPLIASHQQESIHYFKKGQPNPFDQKGFKELLQKHETTSLVVVGISTNNGVKKTVNSAESSGMTTIVLSDATISRSTHTQEATLKEFPNVMTTKALMEQLNTTD